MATLPPIPLTRLLPVPAAGGKPKPQNTAITIIAAQIGKPPETGQGAARSATDAPEGPTPAQLSEEFGVLHLKLLQHQSGDKKMEEREYKDSLRRAIDLVSSMNQTTAGPKAGNKKIGVTKQAPKGLMDL